LNAPDQGGPRMSDEHQNIADIKQQLRTDGAFATPEARCKLYAGLFHAGFGGDAYWDDGEYRSLGCAGLPIAGSPGQ